MKTNHSGFSLVEVTIALGIIAFCVVAVFGLLPTALRSVKEANDRRNAVEVMNGIAGDLLSRSGMETQATNRLSGVFSNVTWSSAVVKTNVIIPADGRLGEPNGQLMKAALEIVPPASRFGAGMAKISIAWPETANINASGVWTNAQGSVRTIVYFNQ